MVSQPETQTESRTRALSASPELMESSEQNTNESDALLDAAANADAYNGVDVTDTKTKIIEYIARNPGATNREVADAVDCAKSYPSRVRGQFPEVILERAEALGSDLSALSDSMDRCEKKQADSWDELSDKQQETLRRLADEPSPADPESSLRDIVGDLSFDTHPTYVSDVLEKYSDFAVKLKQARAQATGDETPAELIDSITLADDEDSMDASTDDAGAQPMESDDVSDGTLAELRSFVEQQKQMAEAEVEHGAQNEIAVGKLVMAEQLETKLNELTAAE